MKADELEWVNCAPPVEEKVIHEVEEILKIKFPPDFVECAMKYHGGHPTKSHFSYNDPDLGLVGDGLGVLLSFDPDDKYNKLLDHNLTPPEFFPEELIIFGEDGGGNCICFDYRNDKEFPSVVFWVHDAFEGENIFFLANSFSEFLDLLEEPVDISKYYPTE